MIASNKKLYPLVTELFIRGKKINIFLFITRSDCAIPKNVRRKSTHYFTMKIPNKQEFQQVVYNNTSDIEFENFMNLHRNVLKTHILF